MYKDGILNSEINRVAGEMGHTDRICIADCGLPVPKGVFRIDLAVKQGLPSFADVLKEIAAHMVFEKIIIAEEMIKQNPETYGMLRELFAHTEWEIVPHKIFKQYTEDCKAIIRTGEVSAYANIILQSACVFS